MFANVVRWKQMRDWLKSEFVMPRWYMLFEGAVFTAVAIYGGFLIYWQV